MEQASNQENAGVESLNKIPVSSQIPNPDKIIH
jgi:hypothetical protein